jgi:hypothetical protein
MIDIEKNWEEFKSELINTEREGVNKLIDYLDQKTDFKNASASTKYHLNVEGGLTQHSLDVLKCGRLLNNQLNPKLDENSITIACLLHDLCKTNYYIKTKILDKEWKDKTDQWRKIDGWKVEDQLPLGHGEKSVIIAVRFIPLSPNEMTAIRWHMSWSDPGVHFSYPSGFPYRETLNKNPLSKLLIIADQLAEFTESYEGNKSV